MFSRKRTSETVEAQQPEVSVDSVSGSTKGRPTPKRRSNAGPASPAPKTRKEAVAWQKQHGSRAVVAGQRKLTGAEYSRAMKAGDPNVLPARDRGPVKALARDYVDSRRMASNYLLWLFPLLLVGYVIPLLQILTMVLFALLVVEWFYSGSRIRKLANERGLQSRDSTLNLAFYAGSRAYFKRSWRRPLPVVQIGDQI